MLRKYVATVEQKTVEDFSGADGGFGHRKCLLGKTNSLEIVVDPGIMVTDGGFRYAMCDMRYRDTQ